MFDDDISPRYLSPFEARHKGPPQLVVSPIRNHTPIRPVERWAIAFSAATLNGFAALMFGATPFSSAMLTVLTVALAWAACWVQAIRVPKNRRLTPKRWFAYRYLDDLSDDTVLSIVESHKSRAAAMRQEAIDGAWSAYRAHAQSPIVTLDPDSWNARRRELAKALADLGEEVPGDE